MVACRSHTRKYTPRDNAGILLARGINLAGPDNGLALAKATLLKVQPGRKLTRGDLVELLVFGTRRTHSRLTGSTVTLDYNGGMSLRGDGSPGGSKLASPIWLESRWKGYSRIISVAKFIL